MWDMKTPTKLRLSRRDVLRVSLEAPADDRTVRAAIRGEPIRELSRIRINAALGRLGLGQLPDPQETLEAPERTGEPTPSSAPAPSA